MPVVDFYEEKQKAKENDLKKKYPQYKADKDFIEKFEKSVTKQKIDDYFKLTRKQKKKVKLCMSEDEFYDMLAYHLCIRRTIRTEMAEDGVSSIQDIMRILEVPEGDTGKEKADKEKVNKE